MAASPRSSRRRPQLAHCRRRDDGPRRLPGALAAAATSIRCCSASRRAFASAKEAALALIPYIERELAKGVRLHSITRHVLGLFRAVPGARAFRRHLATEAVKPGASAAVMADALALVLDSNARFGAHRRLIAPFDAPGDIMLLGYPIGEIAWLALWIVGAGVLVSGILAGLFGIGGGAIIVPVLYEVFRVLDVPEEVRMQMCIGTSLAIIVPTTVRSYYGAQEAGRGDLPRWCGSGRVPAIVGVAIGSRDRQRSRRRRCSRSPSWCSRPSSPCACCSAATAGTSARNCPAAALMRVYGFITGLFSSLVGVSGGAVSNAVLTLYGRPMQQAVATSAGIGVPITIAGTIGYMLAGWPHMAQLPPLSIGFVSLIGFALMAPVSSYHRELRRAAGALAAEAQARDRLRHLPGAGVAAVCRQPVLARLTDTPRSRSLSPRTSQLSSRLRKLMPSRLLLSWPGCATSAGTARSVSPPTARRSSVTAAARVRPLAVSTLTE